MTPPNNWDYLYKEALRKSIQRKEIDLTDTEIDYLFTYIEEGGKIKLGYNETTWNKLTPELQAYLLELWRNDA